MHQFHLRTFADFLAHDHGLSCWCPGCGRFASCDIAMLVRNGLGGRVVDRCRPRCRKCGQRGQWQVRGPVPAR